MTVKSLFMGEVYITGDDYVLSESYDGLTQTYIDHAHCCVSVPFCLACTMHHNLLLQEMLFLVSGIHSDKSLTIG